MAVSSSLVKELREMTGAGILDCKKALEAADGNLEKAVEELKKRNQAVAVKKQDREANEGLIGSYIHGEGRIGVLVEINSETDFVARSDNFQSFVREICLQIAAMSPTYVAPENIPAEEMAKQKEIFMAQIADMDKPAPVKEKIVEGKFKKWYAEVCLLEQPYIRDDSRLVREVMTDVVGTVGENVRIRRFARYALGEAV